MSPSAALSDPVFRAYVGIMLGVLIVAGAVLALLQFVFQIEQGSIWKTYRSWLWMAPLAALVIFAGRAPFIIGVTVVAILAFKEFALVSGLVHDRWMTGAIYAGIMMVGIASLTRTSLAGVAVSVLALILFLPILRNSALGAVQRMSLGMVAFLYLGWLFGHLGFLANATNAYGYFCYLIFATAVNDVSGFTFGKIFGRHPLRSEISPRKTWEGALGALAISMALPWLLRFSFPFFGPWQLLLAGLIVGIGAPLGDLAISVIKRDLGAKDWGAAIPGHGGILDRIDSLIFVAPLFMQMAEYYYPGG
jgi:phosphatidate cytidylyltransferase